MKNYFLLLLFANFEQFVAQSIYSHWVLEPTILNQENVEIIKASSQCK